MNGQIHSASHGNIYVDKFQQQLAGRKRPNREADEIGSKLEESQSILKSARVKLNAIANLETDADFVDPAKLDAKQMTAVLEGINKKANSGIAVKGYFNAEKRVQDTQKHEELNKISGQVTNVGQHLEKTCTTLPGALGGRMTHSEFKGMTFAKFTAKIERCDHSIPAGLNHNKELNLSDGFHGNYTIENGVLMRDKAKVTGKDLVNLMHELSSYKTESSNMLHNIGLEKTGADWHINEAKFNEVIAKNPKLAAQIVDIVVSTKGGGDPSTTNGVNALAQKIFCNKASITPAELAEKLGENSAEGGRSRYELAKILQDLQLRCEVLSKHVHNNETETDATAYMRVSSALLSGSLDTLDKLCGSEIVTNYNTEMEAPAKAKATAEKALTSAQEALKQAEAKRAAAEAAVNRANASVQAATDEKVSFLAETELGEAGIKTKLSTAQTACKEKKGVVAPLQQRLTDAKTAATDYSNLLQDVKDAVSNLVETPGDAELQKVFTDAAGALAEKPGDAELQKVFDAAGALAEKPGDAELQKAFTDAAGALDAKPGDAALQKAVTDAEAALKTAMDELNAAESSVSAAEVLADRLTAHYKAIADAQTEKAIHETEVNAASTAVKTEQGRLPGLKQAVAEAIKEMPRIEAKLVEKNGTASVEVSVTKADGTTVESKSVDPMKFSTGMNKRAKEIAESVEAVCGVIELNPKSVDAAVKGAVSGRYAEQLAEVVSRIQQSREDEAAYNKKCQEETRVLSPKAEEIVNGIINMLKPDTNNVNPSEINAKIKDLKAVLANDLERTESEIDYREACVKNLEALHKVYTEVDKLGTIRDLGDVKAHIGAMWAKMIAELNAQNTENQRTTQQMDNLGRQ